MTLSMKLLGILVCVCLWLVPGSAAAASGGLDPGFGEAGVVMTPLEPDGGGAVKLAVGPDGAAVVGDRSGSYLLRFGPQGEPDLGFGAGGKLALTPDPIGEGIAERSLWLNSFAVDGAGRLLLFGSQTDGRHVYSIPRTYENQTTTESEAVVMRLDPEGALDPTFGAGRGFVRSTFGLRSVFRDKVPQATALVGAVDSRNRPVFVAGTAAIQLGCQAGAVTQFPGAVVRLDEAGAPDPSFGGDGVVSISGSTGAPGLALDAAGRPALDLGPYPQPRLSCRAGTALGRLGADGEKLTGFGRHGIVSLRRNLNLAFATRSGGMVLDHRKGRTFEVVRVGLSGHPDNLFGDGGTANVQLPPAAHLAAVGIDAKGRILLAGHVGPNQFGPQPKGTAGVKPALIVGRLLPNGGLDRSFGARGWVRAPVPGSLRVSATAATLDPQGRLLLAATITAPGSTSGGYLLARFLLDG